MENILLNFVEIRGDNVVFRREILMELAKNLKKIWKNFRVESGSELRLLERLRSQILTAK